MKLIIGGYAQGKLQYALKKYKDADCVILDASLPDEQTDRDKLVVLNHFHNWIKAWLTEKRKCGQSYSSPDEQNADEILEALVKKCLEPYPDCIIISDEVGNGIVPVDAFEREYRELTGRILIRLAGQADEVERVICGMGQKIK